MHHGQPSAGFTGPYQAVQHDQFSKIPARSTGLNAADQLASTPEVGPVQLRSRPVDPSDLITMHRGFELALKAFDLEQWSRI